MRALLLVSLLLAFGAGCSDDGEEGLEAPASADTLVGKAIEKMSVLAALTVEMSGPSGDSQPTIIEKSMDGNFRLVGPGEQGLSCVFGLASQECAASPIRLEETIIADGMVYERDCDDLDAGCSDWISYSMCASNDYLSFPADSPARLALAILGAASDLSVLGSEAVEGFTLTHLRGAYDAWRAAQLVAAGPAIPPPTSIEICCEVADSAWFGYAPADDLPTASPACDASSRIVEAATLEPDHPEDMTELLASVDVWIDPTTALVHRIVVEVPGNQTDIGPLFTLTFSNFDDVTIRPPE